MKNLIFFILFPMAVSAQVQIDKPLQLTGSGLDARVMGIDTAVLGTDAVNLDMLQSNKFNYGGQSIGGAVGEHIITILSLTTITEGVGIYFRSVPSSSGIPTFLTVNGMSAPILDYSSGAPSNFDIIPGKIYHMIFDGSAWQPLGN